MWLYLRNERVEIPKVYLQMYQVGVNRNQLRVSQFFSVDTVPVLVHLAEYDPALMERVLRREPNAYLAMLYWDSEMFHRTTRKRRELEGKDTKDYRALLKEMLFERPADFFNTPHKREVAKQYRKLFIRMDGMARPGTIGKCTRAGGRRPQAPHPAGDLPGYFLRLCSLRQVLPEGR